MISPAEIEQYTEDDRRASEIADRGGRPWPIDGSRALILAVGIFILLAVFASIPLPDRVKAGWPAITLAGVVAGGVYWIAELQRREWFRRHREAMNQIQAERERSAKRWGD
jgi:hypothetical protein